MNRTLAAARVPCPQIATSLPMDVINWMCRVIVLSLSEASDVDETIDVIG